MSIFEYNARLHEETLKKEGYEDGLEKGREVGREEGREVGREEGRFHELCALIDDGILTIEQASARMGIEQEEFLKKKKKEGIPV